VKRNPRSGRDPNLMAWTTAPRVRARRPTGGAARPAPEPLPLPDDPATRTARYRALADAMERWAEAPDEPAPDPLPRLRFRP
jgi:hypothetical protein